jgi:DtxR family transcriptional regulator, Mn-dependent transcriptional regulator
MPMAAIGLDAPRSETADRYLEAIYYIQHEGEVARPGRLADWLGVSAPTVTVTLQRLARDGWIDVAADRSAELTKAGAEAAAAIVRRHRIVERWLTDVLGLDWATADREAAALAHGISAVVLERLDSHLGKPATCPHGNVIPGRRPPKGGNLTRLVDLTPGQVARVARISEVAEHEAPQLLGLLDQRGLVPGTVVTVLDDSGARPRIRIGNVETIVDSQVARAVWVDVQSG